jgi:ATP-dependent Lhr-like helicase
MQLVLHAPFVSRINRAWALALRKRFCRQFNFELQAAATDDALLLSLGPQHSFPLADVFRYLHPASVRDILIQAFLDAPVFATRWRWNATISLAVPRNRGGKKVPPQLQRMQADDLMAAAFPDAAACPEHSAHRQPPDHRLVTRPCVTPARSDGSRWRSACSVASIAASCAGLARHAGAAAFAHDIPNASYQFVDDAPLEEPGRWRCRRGGARTSRATSSVCSTPTPERVRDEMAGPTRPR